MLVEYLTNRNLSDTLLEYYRNEPGLDPELPWYQDVDEAALAALKNPEPDVLDYELSSYDIEVGDIVLADVYQDKTHYYNPKHKTRPFLVTSKDGRKIRGFQLTHDPAFTVKDASVGVEDFLKCGLNGFGYIVLNMRRALEYQYVKRIVGHVSEFTKMSVIDKLKEMAQNDALNKSEFPILNVPGLIDIEIQNLYTIIGR